MTAHALLDGECRGEIRLGEIVEEDAAYTALFVAVLEHEIFIAPFFIPRVQLGPEWRKRVLAGLVEMHRVFRISVIRREIHAAAEPECKAAIRLLRHEHAHVHVHRRRIRIARVKHQRHTHRLPFTAGQLGAMRSGRRWHLVTHHMRERHTATLQHVALFQDATAPAAAFGAIPTVTAEFFSVHLLQTQDDGVLQSQQKFLYCGAIHNCSVDFNCG